MNKIIIFILTIVILSALAQLNLTFEMDQLQFTREGISEGQWWRFITANFVHLSWRHFAMNIIAFGAIYVLFPGKSLGASIIAVCIVCNAWNLDI
jgi:membrane associated rhomboid family serine protease